MFQYFSPQEKTLAAENILTILKKFGGCWITTDFVVNDSPLDRLFTTGIMKKIGQTIDSVTQRKIFQTTFESEDHIFKFFENLNFTVEKRKQIDGSFSLSALDRIGVPDDILKVLQDNLFIWILKPRALN